MVKEIGTSWDRDTRNTINNNFNKLSSDFKGVVKEVSDVAFDKVIDAAKLIWGEPVANKASLPKSATEGHTRMTRDNGKVYRFNGVEWKEIQQIDATAINEVDTRLSEQLAETEKDIEQRGINALTHGVTGDGIADDTQALQALLNATKRVIDIPIPPKAYRITSELIFRNGTVINFIGGNAWSASSGDNRNILFVYDGELALDKAMFRVSTAPVGIEPTSATSNIKINGNVILDGQSKIGWGFYGAYITNDSYIGNILVRSTLVEGIQIEKSWYARYGSLIARSTSGNGVTIGKENWGGINGCEFKYIRASNCGSNFDKNNPRETGYGVGIFSDTIACKFENVISENSYGVGLIDEWGRATEIDTVYLEGNGIGARDAGKTNKCLGLVIIAKKGREANCVRNVYMAGAYGTPDAQAIWLTGEAETGAFYEFNNILYGHYLIADIENYVFTGSIYYGLRLYIEGHLPIKTEVPLASAKTQLYVSKNGSDLNDGRTEITAYQTLAKALEKAKVIKTITTINIAGDIEVESLDFSGLDRPFIFNGVSKSKITNTSNGKTFLIKDASNLVTFKNVTKITRITIENCLNVVIENTPLGHEDVSPLPTLTLYNSKVFLKNSPLSGASSTGTTKNGMLLHNSKANLKGSTITGYTSGRFIRFNDGSEVVGDTSLVSSSDIYWEDGSGYMISGNRIINSFGSLTLA